MVLVEKEISTFKDKNILVVGLARSGTGAANLLSEAGAHVSITDRKPLSSLKEQIDKLSAAIHVIADDESEAVLDTTDLLVISPGVPLDSPLLAAARLKGIPVIGELELAYQVIKSEGRSEKADAVAIHESSSQIRKPEFIGITGTNGKSTTTTLVDLMLKDAGYQTLLGGNIGNALTEEILKIVSSQESAVSRGETPPRPYDYIVAEISSFQLETIKEFRPAVATILNITPDHLDRYDGMRDYIDAKARIFENQTSEDYLILNADDTELLKVRSEKLEIRSERPKVLYFSRQREVDGVYFKGGIIYLNFPLFTFHFPLISLNEIKIKGVHNLENAMAASLIALISGCTPESIRRVLSSFTGLEHRLEFVAEAKSVTFINDSKGTNVGAVAKSLEDFENVILIMGGLDKGNDYSELKDLIKRKVKLLILIGAAKDVIAEALGLLTETHKAADLDEAVALSISKASAGDVVMLSPACASFDMFKDFEDRGRKFKEAVRRQLSEQ